MKVRARWTSDGTITVELDRDTAAQLVAADGLNTEALETLFDCLGWVLRHPRGAAEKDSQRVTTKEIPVTRDILP
jgi:hypothetical protein